MRRTQQPPTPPVAAPYVPPPPPPTPRPAGLLGEIVIEEATSEGLVANEAMKVARSRRAGFNGCYWQARQQNPTAAGTVRIELELDTTGHVSSSSGQVSGSLPQSVADCVSGWLGRSTFQIADAGTARMVLRLRFVPPGVVP